MVFHIISRKKVRGLKWRDGVSSLNDLGRRCRFTAGRYGAFATFFIKILYAELNRSKGRENASRARLKPK